MPTTYAIPNGRTVMDATLYTGNGGTQTVATQTGFKPDFVWIKDRTTSGRDHRNLDTVRGATNTIYSSLNNAEAVESTGLTAFTSTGFTLGSQNAYNGSGDNYVAWCWQAGQGSTSSNTNGSITSTVSVNATAGFSIVTYTGNGSNGASIGHGLGVTPAFFIIKARNSATSWGVYHQSLSSPNNSYLLLNTTDAVATLSGAWTPSSTTITFPTANSLTSGNGNTYVAYCWAEIAGFSKFGSYTGNGSTSGPFIYLGFRPRFILIKRSAANSSPDPSTAYSSWVMYDTARNTYNDMTPNDLYSNLSVGEGYRGNGSSTSGLTDMIIGAVSNGFYLNGPATETNANTGTYIYAAFAENPTKFANAR